jgi:hypothetical protein
MPGHFREFYELLSIHSHRFEIQQVGFLFPPKSDLEADTGVNVKRGRRFGRPR